jgi:hypothetical protein
VHPISVELDLVQPAVALRRRLHQRGELRLDPVGSTSLKATRVFQGKRAVRVKLDGVGVKPLDRLPYAVHDRLGFGPVANSHRSLTCHTPS